MKFICFEIMYVGFNKTSTWKRLALLGDEHYTSAIQEYREMFVRHNKPRPALREAKLTVDAYKAKHKTII
jgi:hypothetical protein